MTPKDFAVKTVDCPCRQNTVIPRCSMNGVECKLENCAMIFMVKIFNEMEEVKI